MENSVWWLTLKTILITQYLILLCIRLKLLGKDITHKENSPQIRYEKEVLIQDNLIHLNCFVAFHSSLVYFNAVHYRCYLRVLLSCVALWSKFYSFFSSAINNLAKRLQSRKLHLKIILVTWGILLVFLILYDELQELEQPPSQPNAQGSKLALVMRGVVCMLCLCLCGSSLDIPAFVQSETPLG